MQFSYLTVYCICVLSTVYRCGCLRREAVRESIQHCIVASVCVLSELSSTADCVQKIFTSENASDVALHVSLETCVPAGQPLSDIGWFTDHPGAGWLTQCWNKTQCQVAVEADGRRVIRVGAVLGGRKGNHHALNPHACPLTLTSLTGIIHVFHGEVQDLNCLDKARLGTLNHTGNGPGTVLWTVPFNVYHSFHKHRARRKFAEKLSSEREKRDAFEKNTDFLETPSHSKIRFPRSDQKLKDIIFADTGDGGNLFTGELTPEEDVWNADLPETLDPIMTFPDDFLDRIILEGFGKGKKAEKQGGPKKAKVSQEKKVLPPVKELPQFSPANNLLPMKTVKEEADSATQPGAESGDLKGRDMLTALEENIENRLQSSLSSLVQDREARNKEELSLIASLALENKVNNALASVDKEANNALASIDEKFDLNQPGSLAVSSTADVKDQPEQVPSTSGVIQVQRSPAPELTRQIQDKNLTVPQLAKLLQNQGQNLSVSRPSPNKEKTVAQPLPPPDETISSIDKPRIPAPNTTNTTTTHPAGQGKPELNSTPTHFNTSRLKGISTNASRLQDGSTNNITNTSLTHGNFTTTNVSSVFANTSASTSSTAYPDLVQQQQPAVSNLSASGGTDGKGVVMLYPAQPPPGELAARGEGRKSGLSQSDLHALKENVIKADALFQRSFEQLKSDMRNGLHVQISPYRKKFLEHLEPHIRVWGYNVSWSMVKQVCKEAVRRMRMKSSGWMAWSLWSSCTMTCGTTGYQIRRRYCQPEKECLGSNYDLRPCPNQPECQGSSVWLDWTAWGRCSVTCGNGGVQFRMRTCLTDDPTMVCHGSGTEFINCSPQPCVQDMTKIPNNQNSGLRKKRKDTHSHTGQAHWKKQKRNPVPVTTILKITPSETNTLVLSTAKPHHRYSRGRHHLRKRLRHSEYSEPNQVENVKVLDSIVDDLQGVLDVKDFNREQHMTPLRITEKDMSSDPAQSIMDENLNDVSWSVWGMWSQCSVSCDRGTQFRRRQCVRRKEGSLDGQTVKSALCQGKSRMRRVCTFFPCPISVAIPKTLVQLNEGKVGRLTCHNRLKGKVRFLYWITPSGEAVTNSSEDGKYVMQNKTLTIHRAQQADLGQYQCVLVGANQIFMPEFNKSTAEGHTKDKDNLDTCMENPCENGGQCEEVMDIWSTTHGMPIHYRCLCPVGFFGRHCEQKSLVHKYTPNLKVMGLVLLVVIILLCITCTCLCVYYWIEGKKRPVDIGPVMTRRRSEDQWRKMKSFDHKARSRKKSFSPKEIKKRLSRMWSGETEEEEEKATVKFGVNSSPYSELVSGLETSVQTEDADEFKTDLTSSSTTAVPKRAGFIKDISQNASPPTVDKGESECEMGVELHNSRKHPDDFQNVEGHYMEFPDHQKHQTERFILQEPPPEFQDNQDAQRYHYEFKGNQKYTVNFQDNESSLTRFKDSLKYQTELQDTQRQYAESKNCSNHVVIKLQDSKLYVDYLDGEKQNVKFVKKRHDDFSEGGGASNDLQGIQRQSPHDMRRQSPGGRPTVVYSDDKMQMFSDSDFLHMQEMEERLKMESYSPFLGSSGESLHNPTTYIYRSQFAQDNVSPQSPPSCMTWHPKRKRRSKKWLRPGRNVEWEFNQNNSDDSSEGSPQPAGEETNSEGTESTSNPPPPPPGFSDHPSATDERGHDSAHQAESEQESDHSQDSTRAKGARPKVRHGPRHQSSGPSSRPSTAVSRTCMAEARDGRKSPNDSRVSSGVDGQRLSLPVADHHDNMVPQLFRMYEVYHPDEPYPFRAARSRRRSRDWAEETPNASSADPGEQAEESAADSSLSRIQETQSTAACAQQSIHTIIPQQRPPNMSPHQPRHLEGGGEGASATVRTDSRKSGRDVLLRRAMENSYILATTGREPWRPSFLASERGASPEDGHRVARDQPTTSECVQSFQTSARAKPESLSPSASSFSSPRAAVLIRADQQDGLNSMARASADSHRDLMSQSLLQDRAATDFSSLQSNLHRVRPASGGQLQADNMNYLQKKSTWNSLGKVCTDSDSADRCSLKRGKAESAKDDSFNPVCLRPNTSGANSNAYTTSGNRSLLSCFDSAGTSVVRRMSLPSDRATQENALKTPVSSASGGGGFRRQVPLTADTGREGSAHNHQLSDDQYFMDNTLESSFNMNQAITSANQGSSLAHLKRYSISDCTQGTQRKRVLKSAMKQQHSGYRLLPVQTKSHPLRRVSFSEPHIHIHNSLDSILDAERRGELECTSDVATDKRLETVGPEQVHLQTNSQLQNGCQGTGVSACRDALSSILFSATGHEQSSSLAGSKEDTDRLWPASRRRTDKLRHGTFLHTQDLHQDDREEAAAPSDGWNLSVTNPDPSLPHSQALTCSQPESRSSFKPPATAGAPRSSVIIPTASGGDREGQPPLLVDIEGHSSSDVPLARQPQSASPPVYSQRLLTPLTPNLAADHPAFADHQRGDVLPAVRAVWEGQRGRGAEAGDTQHAGPGASTQSAPTVTGHLSLHSFQEMLVRRTPGAFFKPIDGTHSSHKSDD